MRGGPVTLTYMKSITAFACLGSTIEGDSNQDQTGAERDQDHGQAQPHRKLEFDTSYRCEERHEQDNSTYVLPLLPESHVEVGFILTTK